jgi:hypothetical protein
MPDFSRQRRVQQFAVGQQSVECVAISASLAGVEPVRQVADRTAALAGKGKRRRRRIGGGAVIGFVAGATLQAKSLTSATCTFGATSSTRTG